ncbi:MAG TPA: peptidoglycan-binding domain-containing protein [Candidatus Paceibacterota bacterium]
MKKITYAIGILSLLSVATPALAACTDIAADIGSGSTGSNVTRLQVYLAEAGYLTATPNGVFGPATLAAAKKFQAANGISSTGFVGPTTRAFIKAKSCATTPTASGSSGSQTNVPAKAPLISSPKAGAVVTIGKTQIIRWASEIKSTYSIILEDKNGISVGYIAITRLGGTQFEWKAGEVYSTESQKNTVVAPGEYKIRIRNTYAGTSADDPQSAVFTLEAQPVAANMIYPKTVSSSDETPIVIYGSGFNDATSIYLNGPFNIRTTKQYVSPDGKVLIFSLTSNMSAGTYSIWAYNGTDSTSLNTNIAAY